MTKTIDKLTEIQTALSNEVGLIYLANGSDDAFWEEKNEA